MNQNKPLSIMERVVNSGVFGASQTAFFRSIALSNGEKSMTTGNQQQQASTASSDTKKRVNCLKFNTAGHIVTSGSDTKKIMGAVNLYNAAMAVLKCEGSAEDILKEVKGAVESAKAVKLGAKITKDEEPQFTTVAEE